LGETQIAKHVGNDHFQFQSLLDDPWKIPLRASRRGGNLAAASFAATDTVRALGLLIELDVAL
jgi:hypothetical protein